MKKFLSIVFAIYFMITAFCITSLATDVNTNISPDFSLPVRVASIFSDGASLAFLVIVALIVVVVLIGFAVFYSKKKKDSSKSDDDKQ